MIASSRPASSRRLPRTPFRSLTTFVVAGMLLATTANMASAIGFIDSPSATCRKIKGNQCAISWYYISVTGSPNYIIFVRVLLGDKVVFHTSGFFQTSAYIPHDMIGDVLVPCGKAGSVSDPVPAPTPDAPGGAPYAYGSSYSYTIQAGDSANLKSANYGTVYCPAK
jgi:hypothetical protein